MEIIMYTKAQCPNCVTAKQLLKSRDYAFEERDIEDEGWAVQFAHMYPDVRQMPQIFINGQRVGGLAGLRVALDKLDDDWK